MRVGSAAAGFAATFAVTAAVGPASAGYLFGTFIWASTAAIVARWGGTDRILVDVPMRALGWRKRSVAPYVNRIVVGTLIRSAVLLAVLGLGIAAGRLLGFPAVLSVAFLVALTPLTACLQVLAATIKATGRQSLAIFFEYAFVPVAVLLAWAIERVATIPASFGFYATVYVVATGVATAAALALAFQGRWNSRLAQPLPHRERQRARDFALVELATVTNGGLALLGLPLIISAAEVGIFNVVFRIAAMIHLISTTAQILMVPKLSLARRRLDRIAFETTLRETRLVMFLTGLTFIPVIYFAASPLLGIAGPEFVSGRAALLILGVMFALGIMTGPAAEVLAVLGQQRTTRRLALLISAVGLIALWPATAVAGIDGAALVTGFAFVLQRSGALYFEHRARRALRWPN